MRQGKIQTIAFLLAFSTALYSASGSQPKEFRKWPAGTSPQEIGKRVTVRFLNTPHLLSQVNQPFITYPESVTWYGALTFAHLSGDKNLSSRLIQRFEPLLNQDAKLVPHPTHVDLTVFGAVPLEIYIQTKQSVYLDLGRKLADEQWTNPTSDGLTNQTRFWIDDMYMVTIVQVQAYRATGETKYLDRAALEMIP
jgi:unsaturated rhamnogalacturonyl hydrolase